MIFFLIAALVGPRLGVVPAEIIERPGGALVGAPIVVQGVMATAVTVLAAAAQPLTVAPARPLLREWRASAVSRQPA